MLIDLLTFLRYTLPRWITARRGDLHVPATWIREQAYSRDGDRP